MSNPTTLFPLFLSKNFRSLSLPVGGQTSLKTTGASSHRSELLTGCLCEIFFISLLIGCCCLCFSAHKDVEEREMELGGWKIDSGTSTTKDEFAGKYYGSDGV